MKILVCISCVPDTTSKINFKNNNTIFDEQGVQFVINPNDEFGLTRAIWFKEKVGATVDVLHVGEDSADPNLRKALAIGADKAIRIDTPARCRSNFKLYPDKPLRLDYRWARIYRLQWFYGPRHDCSKV